MLSILLTSVRGGLFTISLHLHASGNARVGFSSGKIGNVNESVVEGSLDVANAEDVLGVLAGGSLGGSVVDDLLLLGNVLVLLCFLGLRIQNYSS